MNTPSDIVDPHGVADDLVTHLPEAHCPSCGAKIDAATPTNKVDSGPQPGDVSICFYCTEFLEFDHNMQAVKMTEETKKDLSAETYAQLLHLRRQIKDSRHAKLH